MRRQLEEELTTALIPYMRDDTTADVRMRIAMVCSSYEISKAETAMTVYEGNINEKMLQRFLTAKVARGCSRRTVKYYQESILMTLQKIGKPFNEVTADDIRLYLAIRVQKDGVSKTTANNERRNLSSFYTWLQKEEILMRNPMSKVEQIKETKKKKKAFTQMELEQIRYACRSSMETAIIEVLISTWARVSEVAEIKLEDIKGGSVLVHGKGDKERETYLTPKAQMAIKAYLSEREDDNPYLFPGARYGGGMLESATKKCRKLKNKWFTCADLVGEGHRRADTIEQTVRKIGKRAGVDNAHPHRFRRTGATMALRAGMPLITVSKMLGHENIGTTQIYLDISDKELEEAHEKWVV